MTHPTCRQVIVRIVRVASLLGVALNFTKPVVENIIVAAFLRCLLYARRVELLTGIELRVDARNLGIQPGILRRKLLLS